MEPGLPAQESPERSTIRRMAFGWSLVLFVGVLMMVLGPVLLVTKQMVLIGMVLGAVGTLMVFRGLLGISG